MIRERESVCVRESGKCDLLCDHDGDDSQAEEHTEHGAHDGSDDGDNLALVALGRLAPRELPFCKVDFRGRKTRNKPG